MAPEKHTGSDTSYQAFGTDMLRNITRGTLLTAFGNVFKMPDQAFCFYHFEADVPAMWSPDGPAKALPADAVGVQWFGGSPASKERDAGTSPDGPSWLERLARKELE